MCVVVNDNRSIGAVAAPWRRGNFILCSRQAEQNQREREKREPNQIPNTLLHFLPSAAIIASVQAINFLFCHAHFSHCGAQRDNLYRSSSSKARGAGGENWCKFRANNSIKNAITIQISAPSERGPSPINEFAPSIINMRVQWVQWVQRSRSN